MNSFEPIELKSLESRDVATEAADLERSSVMRRLAGPLITNAMQTVFRPEFSQEESTAIRSVYGIGVIQDDFAPSLIRLLKARISAVVEERPGQGKKSSTDQLHELYRARPDLFFNFGIKGVLEEGMESSVIVPLTIASQIYRLESRDDNTFDFDGDAVLEIMSRPDFDKILQHLTQGPNGFLEGKATEPDLRSENFFELFSDPPTTDPGMQGREHLSIEAAYIVEDGRVTGLSGLYHLAALRRIRYIKQRAAENLEEDKDDTGAISKAGYQGALSSSGCPVRHRFVRDGQEQPPLTLTAKDCVAAALKIGMQKFAEGIEAGKSGLLLKPNAAVVS